MRALFDNYWIFCIIHSLYSLALRLVSSGIVQCFGGIFTSIVFGRSARGYQVGP